MEPNKLDLPQTLKPIIGLPEGAARRARPESERKLEWEEMFLVLQQELIERFLHTDKSFVELTLEEEIPNSHGARRAIHELRYTQLTLSATHIVGHVTPTHFRAYQVGVPINEMRAVLKREQPSCDWWVVAYFIEPRDLRRTREVWSDIIDSRVIEEAAAGGRVFGERAPGVSRENFLGQPKDNTQPVAVAANGSTPRTIEEPDIQVIVHLAWADVRRSKLVDPVTVLQQMYGRPDAEVSFMREYAKTQNLDFLSEGARMNRELAKFIMGQYVASQRRLQAEARRLGTTDDPPSETPEKAPRPARVSAPDPSDRKRELILKLRAEGLPPAQIAKRAQVKTERVLQILEEHPGGPSNPDASGS